MMIDTSSNPRTGTAERSSEKPSTSRTFLYKNKFRQAWTSVTSNMPFVYVGLAIVLFLIVFFAPHVFVTLHSGQVGVRYLRFFDGTQVDRTVGEGFTFVFPWDKLYIYDVRVQETKHKITVLTEEGMTVGLHVSIRYRPEAELVGLLHQRIGPDYRDRVVIPEVEVGLRNVMGRVVLKNLFDLETPGVAERIQNNTADRLAINFVELLGVIVVGMDLPPTVKEAIDAKMVQAELADSYAFRLDREKKEAERRRIEADGLNDFNRRLAASITPGLLQWRSIEAAKELALSPNAKTVVLGGGSGGSIQFLLGGEK